MKRMNQNQLEATADKLVSQLEAWHDPKLGATRGANGRAVLAKLGRVFNESTRFDAWEVLGTFFGPDVVADPVYETVAGCFSIHRLVRPDIGNLGATLRAIQRKEEPQGAKRDRYDARFRRLVACDTREELAHFVRQTVRLAKSKEMPVNYRRLFVDLYWWNLRTKTEWARAYWEVPPEPHPALAPPDEQTLEPPTPSEVVPDEG